MSSSPHLVESSVRAGHALLPGDVLGHDRSARAFTGYWLPSDPKRLESGSPT
jgi:hypothetical protein